MPGTKEISAWNFEQNLIHDHLENGYEKRYCLPKKSQLFNIATWIQERGIHFYHCNISKNKFWQILSSQKNFSQK